MPAQRPRASFEPISPDFDLKSFVEANANFHYVDRISCDMIDQQGLPAFEKLILLHVIIGGKPLVIDGFEDRLDPWTFTPKWLRDNCGDKHENSRNLTSKDYLPLTMTHYLENMAMLTNQFFVPGKPEAFREAKRQRVYLKDIDCPPVWQDKLREHVPSALFYLNESTGDVGGPGAVPDPNSNVSGRRLEKGIARAGDLMSSLPPDMRAENLMCYIGHEGTYTPAHREMCASLGQNIMVEASGTVSDDGKAEKPGSSIWFMTESKDRHTVSEYWLSVLGHDIEVENHFAQIVAWKKAPFNVYVVEQRPGDFILIPPLAPHQVWNRGTRTMKVAWNRTTVETLEMALNEALPRSRIVCRDEQYKNKAMIYYTLQKYSGLLTLAQTQASRLPNHEAAHTLLTSAKIRQLAKDFKRLFALYRQILLSEMFNPDEPPPKNIEYLPFDGNVTCAYCRGNISNRFLTCPSCKDILGQSGGEEGDPYDVCMDCYAMGRSCACISGLKWVEQFRWKELAAKYESWRKLIIALDGGYITEKTPLPIIEERKRLGKKTLAEVCKEQLKRRPWKDVHKSASERNEEEKEQDEEEEEIIVDDNGNVKKVQKKKSKTWLKNNSPCHVCCHRHPNWKMAQCTTCERMWCYGTLFRGWDKMPQQIMEDPNWTCPHCLGICFAGACKREGKMKPYEPKGTLLGHDTRKVADARSVEALVDFSVSNMNWIKEDLPSAGSKRLKRVGAEAEKAKAVDPTVEAEDEENEDPGVGDRSRVVFEDEDETTPILDPALGGSGYQDDDSLARRLRQPIGPHGAEEASMGPGATAPDGYAAVSHAGYVPPPANMYPQPDEAGGSYAYPGYARPQSVEPLRDGSEELVGGLRPFKRRRAADDDGEGEDISMSMSKTKKPRLSAAGFKSFDLADGVAASSASKARTEAQRQFEKEKERKALERAKSEGRFIMLQAALREKRKIVRLPIPGHRLQQFQVQAQAQNQARGLARAALMAGGEEADAEHEVDENVAGAGPAGVMLSPTLPQEAEQEDEPDDVLLKSDIPTKKKQNPKEYYEQRQKEGFVLSGGAKKVKIPVERDGNYGLSRDSKAARKSAPGGGPVGKGERRKRKSAATVEYEEVDIGSDQDDNDADDSMFVDSAARAGGAASGGAAGGKRWLPTYLQSRYQDDEDLPDELPMEYRDHSKQKRQSSGAVRQSKPQEKNAGGMFAKAKATGTPQQKPTAGNKPSMRPSNQGLAMDGVADDDANGDYADVDEVLAEPPRPSFSAINKPHPNGTPTTAAKQTPQSQKKQRQKNTIDEQNRLAKLQALEMASTTPAHGSAGRKGGRGVRNSGGGGGVSMVDTLEVSSGQESSSDDDGIEEVPARRVRV